MYNMFLIYKCFIVLVWTRLVLGTIPGLSYMDPIRQRPFGSKLPGEDPCNPLYWYPREIPEYCYFKPPTITITKNPPLPVPLPVAVPQPILMPVPQPQPVPHLPVLPMPLPIMPPPSPIVPPAMPIALPPFNAPPPVVPTVTNPFMAPDISLQSHFPLPYPVHEPQVGLVPGLPGLVTKDGGINIMPFSDAYADMLEKHKNKMIRKKLQRIINEYENFPDTRKYLRLKKYRTFMDF